jgi:hypothetical protein
MAASRSYVSQKSEVGSLRYSALTRAGTKASPAIVGPADRTRGLADLANKGAEYRTICTQQDNVNGSHKLIESLDSRYEW